LLFKIKIDIIKKRPNNSLLEADPISR